MVDEPSHVKQLSLIHLCKIGLMFQHTGLQGEVQMFSTSGVAVRNTGFRLIPSTCQFSYVGGSVGRLVQACVKSPGSTNGAHTFSTLFFGHISSAADLPDSCGVLEILLTKTKEAFSEAGLNECSVGKWVACGWSNSTAQGVVLYVRARVGEACYILMMRRVEEEEGGVCRRDIFILTEVAKVYVYFLLCGGTIF